MEHKLFFQVEINILKMQRIKCSGPFNKEIKTPKGTYSYVAENDEKLEELCIYLPDEAQII